jgi:hypothetical protein
MTRKNFPSVLIGNKKFFVSQRGLIDREPKPMDLVPEENEIRSAIAALHHSQRSSHPTVPISELTMAIRRRYGYISSGAMVVALHRLKIEMTTLSRLEVFAAIRPDWVQSQRGTDRSFVRDKPIKRSTVGSLDADRYSHPGQLVSFTHPGRGSIDVFWFDEAKS